MTHACRSCGSALAWQLADLGPSPLANSFLRPEDLTRMEPFYPLTVYVCERCLLAQLPVFAPPERIFDDYAYLSSYSETWLAHARDYVHTMVQRLALGPQSLVVEIGSNDGYLLQYVRDTKRSLLAFLIDAKDKGRTIAAYGAPAKGNTLLNYCGVRGDFVDYTVDRNPRKQGLFLPGTHIPIHGPERLSETRPDYVLILPWNLQDEIVEQMRIVRQWGGHFVVPVPHAAIVQ